MQPSPTFDRRWKQRAALFLVSQNVSLFGSSVVAFAIIWHITLTTSSGVWMMLSTLCAMVPQALVSLPGGALADRHSRKVLIMLSDGFTALITLALAALFLLGFGRLEWLLVASALRSVGQGIQTPAVGAIYPQLVPKEQLTRVQGINQTAASVLMLIAPPFAGIVLGSLGMVATFFVDILTAALAIGIMSFLRVDPLPRAQTRLSIGADIRAGITYTLCHPQLRRIVLCFAASFFLITPAAVLSPLLVQRTFGSDVWRLTANEVAWTLGSLAGGVFVSLKGAFRDKVLTVAVCLVAFGVLFGLLGVAGHFTVYLLFMGMAGFFLPPISTAQTVHIQEVTEPDKLGRVFSVVQIITASAMPVAILLFGPLADVVPVESLLLASGALLALVGLLYGLGKRPVGNAPLCGLNGSDANEANPEAGEAVAAASAPELGGVIPPETFAEAPPSPEAQR